MTVENQETEQQKSKKRGSSMKVLVAFGISLVAGCALLFGLPYWWPGG